MSKELKNLNLDCLNEEQRKIYDKLQIVRVKNNASWKAVL